MRTKNLLLILGIGSLSLFTSNLEAQIGTGSDRYTTSSDVEEQNSRRLNDLQEQVKDANEQLKDAKRIERDAKSALKEAKAALKAEKQAQKARKQANSQARKARNAVY